MSCPTAFKKNAVACINCAHEACDKDAYVSLCETYELDLEPPAGFMRIDISARFAPGYFEKRPYFFCEEHARQLLPGFFEYFNDEHEDPDPAA